MIEKWKAVPGYEGRYEVSDQGRVRSLDNYVACGFEGKGQRLVKGCILKPGGNAKTGHVTVAIGKGNSKPVHQLVMLAFVGPPPAGHEVLHQNHVADDNRLSNLKYGTRSENLKMDYAAGTRVKVEAFNNQDGGRPVTGVHIATGVEVRFKNAAQATAALKGNAPNIRVSLKNQGRTSYGYQWSYS